MRYDLVVFDNDGVLVDSEPISNRLLAAYLTELGHLTFMSRAQHPLHGYCRIAQGRRCRSR
jgi:beta-phosphoglucomutase-like phosphatase (HAD superfamily)